jgi:hypothetical protein
MYKLCDVSPTLDPRCECLLFHLVSFPSHISFHSHKCMYRSPRQDNGRSAATVLKRYVV